MSLILFHLYHSSWHLGDRAILALKRSENWNLRHLGHFWVWGIPIVLACDIHRATGKSKIDENVVTVSLILQLFGVTGKTCWESDPVFGSHASLSGLRRCWHQPASLLAPPLGKTHTTLGQARLYKYFYSTWVSVFSKQNSALALYLDCPFFFHTLQNVFTHNCLCHFLRQSYKNEHLGT